MTGSGKAVLVLEFCSLGSLSTAVVKYGCMTEVVARRYFTQMVNGVRFIHSKGKLKCNEQCT